jgi:O-antigen ligase
MAALGLMQFATKNSLLGWVSIPGMSGDGLGGVDIRGAFVRAAGTATHPLEYGMMLCMVLPLALTLALEDKERGPVARWLPAVLIAGASVLSVSRSAFIALIVASVVLSVSWSTTRRIVALFSALGLAAVVYVAVPGMVGTVVGLFTGAAQDSSVLSRVNSYDVAFGMITRLPFFGRGFGTLLPSYVYLDNQYLGILVELGLVGFIAVVLLFASTAVSSWVRGRRAHDACQAQVGVGICAAVCAGAASFAFFDALAFPLSSTFLFLILGLGGAYRRIVGATTTHPGPSAPVGLPSIAPTRRDRAHR